MRVKCSEMFRIGRGCLWQGPFSPRWHKAKRDESYRDSDKFDTEVEGSTTDSGAAIAACAVKERASVCSQLGPDIDLRKLETARFGSIILLAIAFAVSWHRQVM